MTTKYIIVDDEDMAHTILEKYCALLANMELMKHCYDAIEAIEYLNGHHVDLIFLDLNMPKLKGFEFLRTLANPPQVIVTTAYKEFAIEGYELNIVDYLLKPFSFERFLKAVNKSFSESKKIPSQPTDDPQDDDSKRIFVKSNKKHIQIITDNILYIEAAGNYSKINLQTETITVRDKIKSLLEVLPINNFVQVHRSFVVATNHIKSVEGNRILIGDSIIPIGKLYKAQIDKIIT